MSGGVASNLYLREKLAMLCDDHGFTLHTPPPHLCTDNGVMIAWSALEQLKWREHEADQSHDHPSQSHDHSSLSHDHPSLSHDHPSQPHCLLYSGRELDSIEFRPKWPLGEDVSDDVKALSIKLPRTPSYFKIHSG